ncbi:hypothetical protein NGM37_42785, partial [Streptomyces sp. TRM76130]|nr:hypothetical protein [Streptomyces sp. TRM76130]
MPYGGTGETPTSAPARDAQARVPPLPSNPGRDGSPTPSATASASPGGAASPTRRGPDLSRTPTQTPTQTPTRERTPAAAVPSPTAGRAV